MMNLKHKLPDLFHHLKKGGLSCSLSEKPFTNIPIDKMIEMTINRSLKEVGGLLGITENKGASKRWMQISHILSGLQLHLDVKTNTG